jgi:PHD/YefM family antitoxin component YafN of YafNO toxin-antitoxin module
MSVIEVPASEFAKHFGRYKDIAQREPVAITSHGRTTGYFMAEHEYVEYQRLKALSRRVYHVSELSGETVAALRSARMNPAHDHLNSLLEN